MSELTIALVAAGSAVAGAAVGGWFARSAGLRQAEAAKHAGDRQADALLHTVQASLDEQRRARVEDRRRTAYSEFLAAVEDVARDPSNDELIPALRVSRTRVVIEGPNSVAICALEFAALAEYSRRADANAARLIRSRLAYVQAVKDVLGIEHEPSTPGPA
ncbi:hypothetical protein [Streptomyces sp. NPDC050535]|uniref:hypothetical protein n=1 Tax=Streptomyces sp. NPDC050535 TaxID=3365626 RepID=UPI00378E6A15